ncbi:uncharacterized protein LOC135476259 [Liolophura sinensis]|uniref:uncharacterized protein LOC135476259 n=1 Tax=Liolophura sinensis TaxID=3198878 RepID=UPI0031582935
MAGGTKFIKEINDQFLICKICHETYKDPKTLTCLHTFCTDCLQQHIDSERERASRFSLYSRYITCPLCRKKTEIPNGGVRRLPDNFLVSNLTDVVNRRRSVKAPSCEICQTMRSRTNQACSKCVECSKLLCKSCVELHRKTKVTEHHSLFDIEDEKDIECKVHPDEIVRFFCEPCETCVCILCTFQEHRDHEVCSFSEGFAKNKTALENLMAKCRGRASDVQNLLSTINKCEMLKKETQESIRDLAISYTSQVRGMEKKLLKKVESVFGGGEFMAFLQNKDWLRESLGNLESTCNLTDVILKDKNLEMLLLKKEIEEKLTMLMEPSLPPVPSDLSKQVKFIPGSVKLGYLSVINGSSDGDSDSLPTDIICSDTQTDTVSMEDTSTTMGYNLAQPFAERSKSLQTDPVEVIQTANKEVGTIPVLTRDKGSDALELDVKSKGVLTERPSCHTVKSQTERTLTYDQESMTSLGGSDVAVNTPLIEMLNKVIQVYPDVTSRGVQAKTGTDMHDHRAKYDTIDSSCVEKIHVDSKQPMTNGTTRDHTPTAPAGLPRTKWPVSNRGIQTMLTEEARLTLRAVTKDSGIMTEHVNIVSDKHDDPSQGQTLSHSFGYGRGAVCRKCKCPVVDRKKGDRESEVTLAENSDVRDQTSAGVAKTTRSFGTDPIKWPDSCKSTETEKIRSSEKSVHVSVSVNDAGTVVDRSLSSVRNKSTSTPVIQHSDLDTQTAAADVKHKSTWSYVRQFSRGTLTDKIEEPDKKATNPQITTRSKTTNTPSVVVSHKASTATVKTMDSSTEILGSEQLKMVPILTDSSTSTDASLHTADECEETTEAGTNKNSILPLLFPVRTSVDGQLPVTVDSFTAMSPVKTRETETLTAQLPLSDRWTSTDVTQLSNASTATNVIHTNDKGVFTPRTAMSDQFTNTPKVELRECETEAIVTTTDNETLTDKMVFSDAQTGSELTFSDSTTWIDFQSHLEADTMTDPTSIKDKEMMVKPTMFSKRTNTSPGVDSLSRSVDGAFQVEFQPVLTRSLPELLLTYFPGPPSEPYQEISIPVPTVERGTMYSPIMTCDQSTMAMSILPTDESLTVSTQTPGAMYGEVNSYDWPYENDDLSYEEKATSTESLVYMGLLSELDNIDELFFVPNVTLETVSSATSLSDVSMETDRIEMLDQEMSTEQISLYDCSTQTYLTISPDEQNFPDPSQLLPSPSSDGSPALCMIDASTNTRPVRTMCRETSTPPRHLLSKSTMTHYVARTDKSTNTARRMSRWDLPQISTSEMGVSTDSLAQEDKDTMTVPSNLRDSCVSTDSMFLDEKMAECIVKLKNVSERLHSPTQKVPNESPFGSRSQLARRKLPDLEDMLIKPREVLENKASSPGDEHSSSSRSLTEDERQKQVQDLLLQTQIALQKTKSDATRKLQPITTLRAKSGDRLAAIEEEHYKSRSLPRQFPEREQLTGVRMGRQAMTPSRLPLLRYNSAPGRIATVPTQKGKMPRSPTRAVPTKIPAPVKAQETMPAQIPPLAADRRSSGQLPSLPAISETRTPSSCSGCSTVSCSSVETSSSGTVSSDIVPQHQLAKKPLSPSYSSSSTSSVQSAADPVKSQRKSAMSFMQKLLPRKKKFSASPSPEPQRPSPIASPKPTPKYKPEEKSPKSPKRARPFVYMRQRIFSIQHDGESSKPKKDKAKKVKSKSKTDISSPGSTRRETEDPGSRDPSACASLPTASKKN